MWRSWQGNFLQGTPVAKKKTTITVLPPKLSNGLDVPFSGVLTAMGLLASQLFFGTIILANDGFLVALKPPFTSWKLGPVSPALSPCLCRQKALPSPDDLEKAQGNDFPC